MDFKDKLKQAREIFNDPEMDDDILYRLIKLAEAYKQVRENIEILANKHIFAPIDSTNHLNEDSNKT